MAGAPADLVLGIETSCDDTSVAVLERGRTLRSHLIAAHGVLDAVSTHGRGSVHGERDCHVLSVSRESLLEDISLANRQLSQT